MNGPFTEADVVAAWEFLFGEERTRTGRLNRTLSELWDALDVAYRSAASRPDGWVACPKEPTAEIDIAARDWSHAKYGKPIGNDASQGVYRAMLAASPYELKESDQ